MARTVDAATTEAKVRPYRYVAYDDEGRRVAGTVRASEELAAERLVVARGLQPISVEIAPSMFSMEEAFPSLFKVNPRDVIVFSRQLATLSKSGISLLPALQILRGQVATSRAFTSIISSVIGDLGAGFSFSQAIAKHPKAFNDIYCRTIAVGEQSGNLETVLIQMADYYERQLSAGKKAKKALSYPLMVLGVGVVVVIVLMIVVMPQLVGMFSSMKVDLPLPTRMLLAATNFFTAYKFYILIAGSLFTALALWLAKQPAGRRLLDRLILTAPVIGPPMLFGELARISRSMAVLLGTGLKLQEIMDMMPQATDNSYVRHALTSVREGLFLGRGLTEPMSEVSIFPPLLIQMVSVGEETNTLDFTLGVVADFYETTADERMSAMVGMVGPMSTIIIAVMVGFIAVAVIMPIYSLTGAF